ncbi:hypothetical protein HO173_007974 [Letharia columbiana]|uniref:cutinase n=1 Tax=Letharia columbiana TaxID=112416 RepID=A0A8H6FS55_9LECA|nr:uncharacterized protein HO173_007974 [Letharia columbiana]KAF6233762.1 hypothetical protein HO173_007974 [Letharia columbiana]
MNRHTKRPSETCDSIFGKLGPRDCFGRKQAPGFTGLPTSVAPASCLGITNGTTDNDLINGVCKNLTLVFARGTTENGNIGDIVGPPFVYALVSMLGEARVAVQGVNNYSADVQDFLAGGSVTGSQKMTQCPGTKLLRRASSTRFFGDPDDGEAFGKVSASKISTDCHIGDDLCLHGDLIPVPHLDYCLDADTEASFAFQKSGLKTVGGAASKSWVSHGEFCAAERITEVEFEDHWWKYCRRDDLHEESTLVGHRLQEALSAPPARNAKHVRSGGEPAMDYEPITAPIPSSDGFKPYIPPKIV